MSHYVLSSLGTRFVSAEVRPSLDKFQALSGPGTPDTRGVSWEGGISIIHAVILLISYIRSSFASFVRFVWKSLNNIAVAPPNHWLRTRPWSCLRSGSYSLSRTGSWPGHTRHCRGRGGRILTQSVSSYHSDQSNFTLLSFAINPDTLLICQHNQLRRLDNGAVNWPDCCRLRFSPWPLFVWLIARDTWAVSAPGAWCHPMKVWCLVTRL